MNFCTYIRVSLIVLLQAATTVIHHQQPQQQQQQAPQTVTLHHGGIIGPYKDHTALRAEILKREPVEPARSPKQLFITDWLVKHKKKKLPDAKEAWKVIYTRVFYTYKMVIEQLMCYIILYYNAFNLILIVRQLVSKRRRSGWKD